MTPLIISAILAIAGLVFLGYIIYKKVPDLKNLNVQSLLEEKQGQTKKNILEARLSRVSGNLRARIETKFLPKKSFLAEKIKHLKSKVSELENRYHGGKNEEDKPKTIEELFTEAEKLINDKSFVEAEGLLIEVIAKDSKNARAYEILGDLYFQMKAHDQAEEIYRYLLKLKIVGENGKSGVKKNKMEELENEALASLDVDSKIAVYYENLGQIYEAMGKKDQALDSYLKATTVEPNNTKYLDKLLEASIKAKDKGLAKNAFNGLKNINPENAKLPEWREAIEKM